MRTLCLREADVQPRDEERNSACNAQHGENARSADCTTVFFPRDRLRWCVARVEPRASSRAPLQLLSRTKAAVDPETEAQGKKKKKILPKLDDFLNKRDYTGAATLIEVRPCAWI